MIVSFTGHRPQKLGGFVVPNPTYDFVVSSLSEVLQKLKPEKAISGMALGVDQWAADICIDLSIPFIAAVPFLEQEKVWPAQSKAKYSELLSKAAEVVIVSEGGYAAWKMQVRNEWMVDNSDIVIAVFDGTSGGTGNCVNYAIKQSKQMVMINPITRLVTYSK